MDPAGGGGEKIIKEAYKAAMSWGMRPKDFWSLTPEEFWWNVELRKPVKMFGKMTEAEVEQIYKETYG